MHKEATMFVNLKLLSRYKQNVWLK